MITLHYSTIKHCDCCGENETSCITLFNSDVPVFSMCQSCTSHISSLMTRFKAHSMIEMRCLGFERMEVMEAVFGHNTAKYLLMGNKEFMRIKDSLTTDLSKDV